MYVTIPLTPRYPNMTFEQMLEFDPMTDNDKYHVINDPSATYTTVRNAVPDKLFSQYSPVHILIAIRSFNEKYKDIIETEDKWGLYNHYQIPKQNGKMRKIDEPLPRLKEAQNELKRLFTVSMPADHHTSAFAYVKKRECLDLVKKHQKNESQWFVKFDFSDFFGSTTPEFVFDMFSQIFPFNYVCVNETGVEALKKALSICFLRGGLPQGSPISPLITNIMMIPIDYKLSKYLRQLNGRRLVYTRYADDMQISCKVNFDPKDVERKIESVLQSFNAPFSLNKEKTHYGSRSGRNWMLGIMLNGDNETTVGYKAKKFFKASLTNYISDKKKANRSWGLDEVQQLAGQLSYYRHIEKPYFDAIVERLGQKFNLNIDEAIKEDLKCMTTCV